MAAAISFSLIMNNMLMWLDVSVPASKVDKGVCKHADNISC